MALRDVSVANRPQRGQQFAAVKELGITQKSAWFMLHRLREACGIEAVPMRGEVEVDETYIGGKESNKHASKKRKVGRGPAGKQAVLGLRNRGGRVKALPIPDTSAATIGQEITRAVEPGAVIYTDEHAAYRQLNGRYQRRTVVPSIKEFVNGKAPTDGIESVWAVMKRGLNGVYHQGSEKPLARYVNAVTFRLNEGNVKRPTMERLNDLIKGAIGKRLTYQELTE